MNQKTTKTEFCRFLNDQGGDIPELEKLFTIYLAGCKQQLKGAIRFGYWLKEKHLATFEKMYNGWWLKPAQKSLWGMVYEGSTGDDTPLPFADPVPEADKP